MQRFKSILIGMLAVAFVGTVFGCKEEAAAASTDWKKSEHNWNVEWNQSGYDVGLNVRNQYRSDYDHVELSVNIQSLTLAVRAAEEDGDREYRPKLTHSLINWNLLDDAEGNDGPINLSLGHRIEYRYYETEGKDANWRYRGIATVGLNILDNINVWGKVQPRFEFGTGKENDLKIDDIKNKTSHDLTTNIIDLEAQMKAMEESK